MVDQNLISDLHELHTELDEELNSLFGSDEAAEQVTALMGEENEEFRPGSILKGPIRSRSAPAAMACGAPRSRSSATARP